MLAEDQPVGAVERHIEGVLRGARHLIVHIHAPVLIALHGVFPVDGVDDAGPYAVVRAGAHRHGHALAQRGAVELVDAALHAVGAHVHDGDERVSAALLAAVVPVAGVAAVAVRAGDLHHAAGDGGGDLGDLHILLHGGDLALLEGQVVFRLALVRLAGVDLQGIAELVARGGLVPLLRQIGDIALRRGDGVFEALLFDQELIHGKLHGLHVVGEQHVALVDHVALLHKDL